MNYKKKICLFAIVGAIAISAMGLGYTGASYTEKEVDHELVRSGVKSDVSIAASICSGNWLDKEQESLIGTQDESSAMSATTH